MNCCCCEHEPEPVGFFQFETASLEIELDKDGWLAGTLDVVVSIVQGRTRLDLHKADLTIDEEASTIVCYLSQEQAGAFDSSKGVAVQVNVLYEDGERDVSETGTVDVFANLYRQVME